jgi:molybdopterin converting factor small subunit
MLQPCSPLMELTILAFAHARLTFGFSSRTVAFDPAETPRGILLRLAPGADLQHLAVAVDSEYASLDDPIGPAGELALIPPVSGG